MLKSKIIAATISMLIALGVLSSEPSTHAILEEGYTITDLKEEIGSGLIFETERLIITPTKNEDLDILSKYLLNPNITKYLDLDPDSAVSQGFKNKDEALSFLKCEGSSEYNDAMEFTIKLKDSNLPIGKLDLMLYENYNMFSVGYWLGEEFQGQGYMSEACFEVCNIAFKASDIKKLYVACDQKNEGSHKLANKILTHIKEVNNDMELFSHDEPKTVDYGKGTLNYFEMTLQKNKNEK